LLWPFELIPVSVPTLAPPHPVAGSFGPVIVKPLRFSEMFGTPNAMQAAPVTWHGWFAGRLQATSPATREAAAPAPQPKNVRLVPRSP